MVVKAGTITDHGIHMVTRVRTDNVDLTTVKTRILCHVLEDDHS